MKEEIKKNKEESASPDTKKLGVPPFPLTEEEKEREKAIDKKDEKLKK